MFGVSVSLSQEVIDLITKDVESHLLRNPNHKFLDYIELSCTDQLNEELSSKGFPPFEYAIIFRFIDGIVQDIHVDGVDANNLRKSSLNVLTHGDQATFEWFVISEKLLIDDKAKIKSFKFDHVPEDKKKLIFSWSVPKTHFVKTNIPHRFVAHEPINLVCIRFRENPDFHDLKKNLK